MKLYNTLTRSKEEFKPLVPGEVKMYSCGPTVYNYFHLGNARPFIVFDCLRQFLEYRGYDVKFVQNFTDVDDKLINKAREEGTTVPEIAEKYIKEYFVDAKALGIKMGAPFFKIRDLVEKHGVAVFSGNMALYGNMSQRVRWVLEEFAPAVEV